MAAACESLQVMFENRLPESPKISDLFPRLPLKENPSSPFQHLTNSLSSNSIFNDFNNHAAERFSSINKSQSLLSFSNNYIGDADAYKKSDSSTSLHSLCTDGDGSVESCEDDIDDSNDNNNNDTKTDDDYWRMKGSINTRRHSRRSSWSSNGNIGDFPPPISCIGRAGRPWVFFKTYRNHERVILKEVRIPTHEFLEAYREGGHLRLHFIQPDDDLVEQDEDEEDQDQDQDGEEQDKHDEEHEEEEDIQDMQKEEQSHDMETTMESQERYDKIETTAEGQGEQEQEQEHNIETTAEGQGKQEP